jgi:hypothetical protein
MIRTNDVSFKCVEARQEQERARRTFREAPPSARALASERLPDGAWRGQRCFIVAGGPSLKGFGFSRLRGEHVIVINKSFLDVPFADVMFAMDRPLIDDLASGKLGENYRRGFEDFPGVKLWLDLSSYTYPPGIYSVPSAGEIGWTTSLRDGLYHGQNSGYAALGLAIVLGASPIYLLGYDMAKGPGGEKHYHDGYPSGWNPEALNIFLKAFQAGAKLLPPGGPQIVNLNPMSALKCFEFGDVDQVLPKARPANRGITVITPTGDRPLAFGLCWRWMARQTKTPSQWIIIDDGKTAMGSSEIPMTAPGLPAWIQYVRREPRSDDPKVTLDLNMRVALESGVTGDKVLIMEDDEYYAPGYIEEMSRRLDSHEVVGICDSKYYHLPTGGWDNCRNMAHASLAQTGFRASFLPTFSEFVGKGIYPDWLDTQIWRFVQASKKTASPIAFQLFVDSAEPLYVGMKGLPGRSGIGSGHNPTMYRRHRDTPDRAQLKKWIPKDYQIYLDVLKEMQ